MGYFDSAIVMGLIAFLGMNVLHVVGWFDWLPAAIIRVLDKAS